ncbi:ImmA/IrrE family metallo-endopeptidase [Tundrisphaera sp. TA3]|uniref:ImmA/IrrE family metallo-endopeptidase n=1 Tax=Tundrisphaera sp. TA3 TaxID=3435775 RepID=UPI003EB867E4
MIDISQGLFLANKHFPKGPEFISEMIGADLVFLPLGNSTGWCIRRGNKSIITINSNDAPVRQRFTLAHEIAHLILGITPDVNPLGPLSSRRNSEKAINSLASELLLPGNRLLHMVGRAPVDLYVIQKIAQTANVSEIVAARRIADHYEELGLANAGLIEFIDNEFGSNWSKTLEVNPRVASHLMAKTQESSDTLHIIERDTDTLFACVRLAWGTKFSYLLVQVVSKANFIEIPTGEQIRQLEYWLYDGNESFRTSLNGCFGIFKKLAHGMTLEQAVEEFYKKYGPRWKTIGQTKMFEPKGKKYVELRLRLYTNR